METNTTAAAPDMAGAEIAEADLAPGEHHHPGVRVYVTIAAILGGVTLVEISTYYIDALRPYLLPILLVLGAAKFALVAMYFMHLKFDSPIFRRVFVAAIVLALIVFSIILATFGVFTRGGVA